MSDGKRTIDGSEDMPEGKKKKLEEPGSADLKPGSMDLELNTGARMPQVQFGTYKMKKDGCYKGVLSALRLINSFSYIYHITKSSEIVFVKFSPNTVYLKNNFSFKSIEIEICRS